MRIAWHKLTGQAVAIKTYEKAKMKDSNQLRRVQQEIRLMEKLNNPLVIHFFEAVESPRRIHIIMEILRGGNLCSYVKRRRQLDEGESRQILLQVTEGLEYMHNQNIVHRDIKLENVLFDQSHNAKLIDFGFSVYAKDKKLRMFCGTPSYMAPEIVKRGEYRGKPVDMWSLGVVLYACLCGCFPFSAKTYPDLYKKIIRGYFRLPETMSHSVRDLLRNLLLPDPNRRFAIGQVKTHPWMRMTVMQAGALNTDSLSDYTVSPDPRDDVYKELVTRMEALGVGREGIVNDILRQQKNSITTCYYLMLAAMKLRQHKAAEKRASF